MKGGWFDIHFISDTNINSAGFYATFKVYDGAGSVPTVSGGSVDRGRSRPSDHCLVQSIR